MYLRLEIYEKITLNVTLNTFTLFSVNSVKDRKIGQNAATVPETTTRSGCLEHALRKHLLRARRKRAGLLVLCMALKAPGGKNAHQARAKTSEVIRQEVIVVKINIISTG